MSQPPQSRSPSPAQPPPIAQTPGPRAAALQKLYNDAISHTLRTCSYSNFASCFPTAANHAPEAMKQLHTDFIEKLDRSCKTNFEVVLREREVVASLNELDRLVEDARRRRDGAVAAAAVAGGEQAGKDVKPPVPYVHQLILRGMVYSQPYRPHTLPASSLYLSHLAPVLSEHQISLSTRLQTAQSENTNLIASVQSQRHEIESLVSQLERTIAEIDAANDTMPIDDMEALTQEAVALDIDLRKAAA